MKIVFSLIWRKLYLELIESHGLRKDFKKKIKIVSVVAKRWKIGPKPGCTWAL